MNAVIYARYSSDGQREESIEGQLRECKEYAEQKGLTIIGTYIDRAFSAKTDNRPDFQRMIKDSVKRLFEVILVWKVDRFARDRYDSAHYKRILKKNGVSVVSVKEYMGEGATAVITEALLEGMAEYYSVELSEKVTRGMKENSLKGKHNGGTLPMGYVGDDQQRYAIDERTAPVVRELFTRYADGETVIDITHSFNERGLKTNRNRPFTKNILHRILKNRKYTGVLFHGEVELPDVIPAIIDKELFGQVQQLLERYKRAPAHTKSKANYLLTTKLICGKCGAFMVGESGQGKLGKLYYYYKCAHTKRKKICDKKAVKKDWIERLVVSETKRLVLNDKRINSLADEIMAYQAQDSIALPALERQLQETEKKISNMLAALEEGIFTPSTKQRLEELEAHKEELEISIAQEKIQRPVFTKEQVVFWISRFKNGNIDDEKYRQSIIAIFVNSVFLYDDKLVLMFNYKDGTKTLTLAEIEGSDLGASAPPNAKRHPQGCLFALPARSE